jgi:hypothetical protein
MKSKRVGRRSTWLNRASTTCPPSNSRGARTRKATPMPASKRVALARGKGTPWSVVKIVRLRSVRPLWSIAFRRRPTPSSTCRTAV